MKKPKNSAWKIHIFQTHMVCGRNRIINQLAQSEDQAAIFDGWSACLNYFDSSLPFQLSFLNHRSRPGSRYSVNIPMQDDDYNSVRCEYVEMLENQIAKSNNGIVRTKLLTFGVNVDDLSTARARLERVEADICGNFKKLGVKCNYHYIVPQFTADTDVKLARTKIFDEFSESKEDGTITRPVLGFDTNPRNTFI